MHVYTCTSTNVHVIIYMYNYMNMWFFNFAHTGRSIGYNSSWLGKNERKCTDVSFCKIKLTCIQHDLYLQYIV